VRRLPSSGRGAVLIMTLFMLLLLAIFAGATIRLSSSSLIIAGNMQTQRMLESAAQQAIESSLNSSSFYNDQINQTGPWAGGATTTNLSINGFTVTLNKPKCLSAQTASGFSGLSTLVSFEDTWWEVQATATDSLTGATVDVAQGVKITLPIGNCVWP